MPWGISHRYEFIFIHIPKTAGTSLCSVRNGSLLKEIFQSTGVLGGTHKTAIEIRDMYPHLWDKYYKFTVVRNPYDRFVSQFFYRDLQYCHKYIDNWNEENIDVMLPQLHWITTGLNGHDYGPIIVDKIIKYEYLFKEIKTLFKKFDIKIPESLPHYRKTRANNSYKLYYRNDLKSLVSYIYRHDLKALNYKWEG